MATDLVSIYNQALSSAGISRRVSLPTENSVEAEACNLWYGHVVDVVLCASRWHSATKSARLAVLKTRTNADGSWAADDPAPGYQIAYSAPSDMLRPQFLSTFRKFEPGIYDEKRAIFADEEDAILTYTFRNENFLLWEPTLLQAVIHALAAHITMPLTGKPQRAVNALERSNNLIVAARVTQANDSYQHLDVLPEWLEARGYAEAGPRTRYYYPHGELFSISNIK